MTISKILTHPSEAELASAVQENLYALFRYKRLGFREVAGKIGIYVWEGH